MIQNQPERMPMFGTAADVYENIRRVHPVTLRRALKRGDIRGRLHGTRIFYELQSVVDWMRGEDRMPSPQRPAPPKRRRGRPRKIRQELA